MPEAMKMGVGPDPLDALIERAIGAHSAWVLVRMPLEINTAPDNEMLRFSLHGTPNTPAEFLLALDGVVSAIRGAFHMQGVCPDEALNALMAQIDEDTGG